MDLFQEFLCAEMRWSHDVAADHGNLEFSRRSSLAIRYNKSSDVIEKSDVIKEYSSRL